MTEEKLLEAGTSQSFESSDLNISEITKKRKLEMSTSDENMKKLKHDLSIQMRACKRLLSNLRIRKTHQDYSWVFLNPVDPVVNRCPDYNDIVKNPMDLNTMQTNFNNGLYKTPQQFKDDIYLMINNCLLYNGPDHQIVPICNRFKKEFDIRFQNINKSVSQTEVLAKESAQLLTRMGRSKNRFIEGDLPNDKKIILSEIKKVQDYLNKLLKKLEELEEIDDEISDFKEPEKPAVPKKKRQRKRPLQKQKSVTKAARNDTIRKSLEKKKIDEIKQADPELNFSSDDDELLPMNYEEKQKLVQEINKLPSQNIDFIRKMVQKYQPEAYQKDGDSYNINFASCDSKIMRKFQKYVNNFYHPKVKRASPIPSKDKLEKHPELVKQWKQKLETEKTSCEKKLTSFEERLNVYVSKKASVENDSSSDSETSSESNRSSSSSSSSSSTDSDN